jgi:hypothetical protein
MWEVKAAVGNTGASGKSGKWDIVGSKACKIRNKDSIRKNK